MKAYQQALKGTRGGLCVGAAGVGVAVGQGGRACTIARLVRDVYLLFETLAFCCLARCLVVILMPAPLPAHNQSHCIVAIAQPQLRMRSRTDGALKMAHQVMQQLDTLQRPCIASNLWRGLSDRVC